MDWAGAKDIREGKGMQVSDAVRTGLGSLCFLLVISYSAPVMRAQGAAPLEQGPASEEKESRNVTLPRTVEDWTVLTLDKSDLKMIPPTPGEMDKLEKYTRERWQVQWRDLDPIDLYVIKPTGVEHPPVILYLYSEETATKQPFINDGWCQRATNQGFAAVGFVPALTEDRFQMRPMKQWFISELQESLGTTTHDVEMVLNYLALRQDIDVSHVGILGIGSGATVGILAAAADPRISALDLINPWADWPNWLAATPLIYPVERKDFVTPEFEKKVASLDPVKWLPTLKTQRVRIQFVDEAMGERKEMKAAMASLEAAATKNVEIIHFSTQKDIENSVYKTGGSFQWVKDQIRPRALLSPVGVAATESGLSSAKQ